MSACIEEIAVSFTRERDRGVEALRRDHELEGFFAAVEARALRIAEIAVRNREDALDLVQDAMIRLVRHYAGRDRAEWTPLFYRILQNRVRDFKRRQKVRNRVMTWFGRPRDDGEDHDPVALAPDPSGRTPQAVLETNEAMQELERALSKLPARQREAFMLRTFEGLDVAETALAMGVSDGSVKTHYSRAIHALRKALGEHWS